MEIIGLIGAGLLLYAFAMVMKQKWSAESAVYDLVNLAGSLMLAIYALSTGTLPFLIINLVWAGFSLRDYMEKRDSKRKL